jgi:spermidine synthase
VSNRSAPPALPLPLPSSPSRPRAAVVSGLVVGSGFAALVYQVLWVRQLGLLVGSTAQAAALAIAIFFAGLALGGAFWGRRAATTGDGLRGFGALEVAVAVTALGHLVLLDVHHALYPLLYGAAGGRPGTDLLLKVLVATVILLPPSFLMGGTLPMLGQHLVRQRDQLARVGTRLYALNTSGSAAGALAAGFVLPVALGFRGAYLLAVALDLTVGLLALWLSRGSERRRRSRDTSPVTSPGSALSPARSRVPATIATVAFVSGFATLAVEVVWTRLFAQVLQNSTYTYALVLTTFLVALALGAVVANRLSRLALRPASVLIALLGVSGIGTALSASVFAAATDGLAYVGAERGWTGYLVAVVGLALTVMLLPAIVFGTVLPYLFRTLEDRDGAPGELIGRLIAVNTAGAIAGALTAGFVLLPLLGSARSILAVAALYPLVVVGAVLQRDATRRRRGAALVVVASVLAGILLVPVEQLGVRLRDGSGERLLDLREGVQANIAVVERGGSRSIRVNNHYTLGSSGARHAERDQTLIPLLTHPDPPTSVFFLGMGTGITAGAALSLPVERVVVCELIADVVDVARDHFRIWTNGLFRDPRVEVHAEDGRTCLQRSPDTYDVIISDLFTPWKAGTGNLYSRDHYLTARDRLAPGGRYVQWVPLYQVSDAELGSIARTLDDVFDEVTMWRGDFFPSRSVVALVGAVDPTPLDLAAAVDNARELAPDRDADELADLLLRLYAGNVTRTGRFDGHPVNTDARPVIEYLAPRTHRDARTGAVSFVVGEERERLYDDLLDALPPTQDPFLSALTDRERGQVLAGRDWSTHVWAHAEGRWRTAQAAERRFRSRTADDAASTPARTLWPR